MQFAKDLHWIAIKSSRPQYNISSSMARRGEKLRSCQSRKQAKDNEEMQARPKVNQASSRQQAAPSSPLPPEIEMTPITFFSNVQLISGDTTASYRVLSLQSHRYCLLLSYEEHFQKSVRQMI